MRAFLITLLALILGTSTLAEVPEIDSFRAVPQYPRPVPGSALALATPDSGTGRLVLWDGDAVYYQERPLDVNGPQLVEVATGYLGDPSFIAFDSGNRRVILGSGADALVYEISDIRNPVDFAPGVEYDVVTFATGALLDNSMLILDRVRDDLTGAELVVVDIALAKAGAPTAVRAVLQKPAGSSPANVFVDQNAGRVYLMDPVSGELRWFSRNALRDAFTNLAPLDWATNGTLIGTAGQFLNGGVYGVNPDNELLIGGDSGVAGSGGIQYVSQTAPASIIDTLDPAGTGPAYVLVYSRAQDEVLAIDPSVSPPVAYASTDLIPAIPPDSPCADFDEIELEFAAFLDAFAPGMTDLDGDTIRDTAMLALLELYSCRVNETSALGFSTNTAYDDNREVFATELNAATLEPYERILPVLLSMNQAMRTAVLGLLSTGGAPLTGSYVTISCTDLENCLPEFVEDAFFTRSIPRGVATEPYFGSGDPDGDELTNLEEYTNSEALGGDDLDFALAAASEFLDGTGGHSGGSGGCFIATAAYGTPMSAELDTLRGIRDRHLLTHSAGGAFADAYYRTSPTLAAWVAERPAARAAARIALTPLVSGRAAVLAALTLLAAASVIAGAVRKPAVVSRK